MQPLPFASYTIAGHTVSCFLGTNFVLVTRRGEPKKSARRIIIPGESVEAHAAAPGPDILWLALTGDTCRALVSYDPLADLWHELDLTTIEARYGLIETLPCILTGEDGLPVWWISRASLADEETLVISLTKADGVPKAIALPGDFVKASMQDGTPLVQTSQGSYPLDNATKKDN